MFSDTEDSANAGNLPLSETECGNQAGSDKSESAMSDSGNFAVRVQNISKCYQIYDAPRDRLKQFVAPRLQRLLGKTPKHYFREFWALKDVSFEIKKGQTVGIIGRNGSGKSTLLQIICGTLSPTNGLIETNGRIAALLELGSGFNPEFTGRENVYMNASVLGLTKAEIDAKYDDILAFADIGEFIDQPVKQYSSGMYVRLAFAVIANVNANVLVIDEALAVGDVFFRQKCMRFLHDFKVNGTVIFVTHDSGAVVNLCDHAIWLDRGEIQAIGSAKIVCEKYLAKRYEAVSWTSSMPKDEERIMKPGNKEILIEEFQSKRDMRMQFINHSNLRNDIQVYDFSPNTRGFGNGGAKITSARLLDLDGRQLSWIVGGELVRFVVEAKVLAPCNNVIVGMNVKDKLGQVLFGQNTYLDYCRCPVKAQPDETVEAVFTFRMPILPRGSYMIDVAIADGSLPDVIQLQWLHDALNLESHASSNVGGLIGLVFDSIELRNTQTDIDL
ncbi:MAG: transporter ATP-binding protein [Nitrosospira multiformis]|jgi:lipopolysaccharide transport system ATP-binding protein|nr:transporter ATP-binding protein [Nitrosospira multiformis]